MTLLHWFWPLWDEWMSTLQAESHWKLWVPFPSKPYTTLYLKWRHLINLFSCNNECWPVADQYCCSQLIASKLNAAGALSQDEVRRESLVRDSGPSAERFQICLNQECRTLLLSKKKKKASPYSQQVDLLICIQEKAHTHFHTDAPFTAEEASVHPPPPCHYTTLHSNKPTLHHRIHLFRKMLPCAFQFIIWSLSL